MKTALVIDDDKGIRTTLRIHLETMGMVTALARTGRRVSRPSMS